MFISGSKSLALGVLAALALSSASTMAVAQTFVYEFDPASAGGVRGNVTVRYSGATTAAVSADLDFSKLDVAAVRQADGNCTGEPTAYKWHIHVKWNSTKSSDAFAQCSKAATSNHYDPLFACGANSEFAETPQCLPKIASYACSPANYSANPAVCEKGDLSGKLGDLTLDAAKRARGQWTDAHYPTLAENTPQWNIILHAVCGKNTPRVACALGKRVDKDADRKGGDYDDRDCNKHGGGDGDKYSGDKRDDKYGGGDGDKRGDKHGNGGGDSAPTTYKPTYRMHVKIKWLGESADDDESAE